MSQYTIYGRAGCQPCQQAKDLLKSKGLTFTYYDIFALPPEDLEGFMEKGHKSVPQIYKGDKHLGGLVDLKADIQETQ